MHAPCATPPTCPKWPLVGSLSSRAAKNCGARRPFSHNETRTRASENATNGVRVGSSEGLDSNPLTPTTEQYTDVAACKHDKTRTRELARGKTERGNKMRGRRGDKAQRLKSEDSSDHVRCSSSRRSSSLCRISTPTMQHVYCSLCRPRASQMEARRLVRLSARQEPTRRTAWPTVFAYLCLPDRIRSEHEFPAFYSSSFALRLLYADAKKLLIAIIVHNWRGLIGHEPPCGLSRADSHEVVVGCLVLNCLSAAWLRAYLSPMP